jgi:hypothetical protein
MIVRRFKVCVTRRLQRQRANRLAVASRTVAACLLLSGCSVDGTGFVAGRVTQGDGGYAVQVYSLGAEVSTRGGMPGLTLGYQSTVYVFPDAPDQPAAGWYVGRVPLATSLAVSTHQEATGLALDLGEDLALTLGYRARTVMARLPADSDAVLAVDLDLADLAALAVRFHCQGGSLCD